MYFLTRENVGNIYAAKITMKHPSIGRLGFDRAMVLQQIELLLPGGNVARIREDRFKHLAKIFAKKLRIVIGFVSTRFEVPAGYEDETGFHYGTRPVPTESNQPLLVQA